MFDMHSFTLIAVKDIKRSLKRPSIYLALAFSLALITIYAWLFSQAGSSGLIDSGDGFINFSLFTALAIQSFYMAVSSVTAVARERQDKTLEVLFYGPVDEASFILAKFVGKMVPYLVILLATVAYTALLAAVFGMAITWSLVKFAVLSLLFVSCITTLGIMLSAVTASVSGSIFVLIIFMVAMFALKVAGAILGYIPAIDPSLNTAKSLVHTLIDVTQYVSPVEYFGVGIDYLNSGDWVKYAAAVFYPLVYSIVVLAAAVLALKKRGVKQ